MKCQEIEESVEVGNREIGQLEIEQLGNRVIEQPGKDGGTRWSEPASVPD